MIIMGRRKIYLYTGMNEKSLKEILTVTIDKVSRKYQTQHPLSSLLYLQKLNAQSCAASLGKSKQWFACTQQ